MDRISQKIKRFLTSPRTIISLIVTTILACLSGILIPQVTDKSPAYFERWKEENPFTFNVIELLQLNRVYTSVWFLTLISIIMLLLGYTVYLQIKKNIRHSVPFNRWGVVILHTGLLFLVISGIIAFSLQRRGFVQIEEGVVFSGNDRDFLVRDYGVFVREFNTDFKVHLSRFTHTYYDTGEVKSLESSIVVIDKDGKFQRHSISPNNTLSINGTKIYQSNNYGYVLTFILKRERGADVMTHYFLDIPDRKDKPLIMKDDYPETGYIFFIKFYPDISMESFHLKRPILYLTVFEGNLMIFDGLVIPKDAIRLRGDILIFADIRQWSGILFSKNPGKSLAYAGFITAILGATIFYFPVKVRSQKGPVKDSGIQG